MERVVPGIYQHFKGNQYEVFGIVMEKDTGEELVLYRTLYGDYSYWLRPKEMFFENVNAESGIVQRFHIIKEKSLEITECSARHSETRDIYVIKESTFNSKSLIVAIRFASDAFILEHR